MTQREEHRKLEYSQRHLHLTSYKLLGFPITSYCMKMPVIGSPEAEGGARHKFRQTLINCEGYWSVLVYRHSQRSVTDHTSVLCGWTLIFSHRHTRSKPTKQLLIPSTLFFKSEQPSNSTTQV